MDKTRELHVTNQLDSSLSTWHPSIWFRHVRYTVTVYKQSTPIRNRAGAVPRRGSSRRPPASDLSFRSMSFSLFCMVPLLLFLCFFFLQVDVLNRHGRYCAHQRVSYIVYDTRGTRVLHARLLSATTTPLFGATSAHVIPQHKTCAHIALHRTALVIRNSYQSN